MRILHLDSGREMRGGQWQVLRLHQALIAAGHESLLLAREDGPLLRMAEQRSLPCQPLRVLRVAHQSRRFDLVHAHDSRSHTWAALFSRVPLIVSRRVAFPIRTPAGSRWKYRRVSRFLAVSKFVAGELVAVGIDQNRIDIVYDGVEVPANPSTGETILTPYTLDPAKGLALAEEAAVLAGLPLVQSKNLEQDLPHCRALVYLTQSEGLGSGILLGMASGVAVIASRVGGIPELIEDGVTGILVQNEANLVATAMRRLDPAFCQKLGQAAREAVVNRFTVSHMANATLAAYRKVLA